MPDKNWEPDILTQVVEQLKSLRREVQEHAKSDEDMYRHIDASLQEVRQMIDKKYVTQNEFKPIKLIVYGIVSICMGAVLTAIVALVVTAKGHAAP